MRTPESILTDALFATAFAQDLMIADLLRRMGAYGDGLRPRSRTNLRQMITHLKSASRFADELWEELFDADAEHKWKNVQTWQDEANELARLILLWEDREPLPDVCNEIFRYIRETKSEGVVDEAMLKQYYLIKGSK